ncbi:hypothetical protein K523DRAFT_421901, partial [Schizophyllum commune Tattone D]
MTWRSRSPACARGRLGRGFYPRCPCSRARGLSRGRHRATALSCAPAVTPPTQPPPPPTLVPAMRAIGKIRARGRPPPFPPCQLPPLTQDRRNRRNRPPPSRLSPISSMRPGTGLRAADGATRPPIRPPVASDAVRECIEPIALCARPASRTSARSAHAYQPPLPVLAATDHPLRHRRGRRAVPIPYRRVADRDNRSSSPDVPEEDRLFLEMVMGLPDLNELTSVFDPLPPPLPSPMDADGPQAEKPDIDSEQASQPEPTGGQSGAAGTTSAPDPTGEVGPPRMDDPSNISGPVGKSGPTEASGPTGVLGSAIHSGPATTPGPADGGSQMGEGSGGADGGSQTGEGSGGAQAGQHGSRSTSETRERIVNRVVIELPTYAEVVRQQRKQKQQSKRASGSSRGRKAAKEVEEHVEDEEEDLVEPVTFADAVEVMEEPEEDAASKIEKVLKANTEDKASKPFLGNCIANIFDPLHEAKHGNRDPPASSVENMKQQAMNGEFRTMERETPFVLVTKKDFVDMSTLTTDVKAPLHLVRFNRAARATSFIYQGNTRRQALWSAFLELTGLRPDLKFGDVVVQDLPEEHASLYQKLGQVYTAVYDDDELEKMPEVRHSLGNNNKIAPVPDTPEHTLLNLLAFVADSVRLSRKADMTTAEAQAARKQALADVVKAVRVGNYSAKILELFKSQLHVVTAFRELGRVPLIKTSKEPRALICNPQRLLSLARSGFELLKYLLQLTELITIIITTWSPELEEARRHGVQNFSPVFLELASACIRWSDVDEHILTPAE